MDNSQLPESSPGIDLDNLTSGTQARVLVIDDEPDTVTLLKQIFQREGFNVSGAITGKDAVIRIPELNPSLILLDLMMPVMDGWQTLQMIRQITDAPVIVISAIGQKEYIVKALQSGVDDYITKPFDRAEVIARSQAVLRRSGTQQDRNNIAFPGIQLVIDYATQEVRYKGRLIQLTGKMFEVLSILARSAPHVVTYEHINHQIWGEDSTLIRNRLKYLVYLLRNEFDAIDNRRKIILNIDRLGYRLDSEEK